MRANLERGGQLPPSLFWLRKTGRLRTGTSHRETFALGVLLGRFSNAHNRIRHGYHPDETH